MTDTLTEGRLTVDDVLITPAEVREYDDATIRGAYAGLYDYAMRIRRERDALRARLSEYTEGKCAVTEPPSGCADIVWLVYFREPGGTVKLQAPARWTGLGYLVSDTGETVRPQPGSRYYPLPGGKAVSGIF